MATKHITDIQVLEAYIIFSAGGTNSGPFPYETLMRWTGQCEKVCYKAMERAARRDLIDYGVSLRTGFLTSKGKELLCQSKAS